MYHFDRRRSGISQHYVVRDLDVRFYKGLELAGGVRYQVTLTFPGCFSLVEVDLLGEWEALVDVYRINRVLEKEEPLLGTFRLEIGSQLRFSRVDLSTWSAANGVAMDELVLDVLDMMKSVDSIEGPVVIPEEPQPRTSRYERPPVI